MPSGRIVTYINETNVTTASAVSVDEFVLLHKSSFKECTVACDDVGWRRNYSGAASVDQMWPGKAGPCKLDSKFKRQF